MKSYYFRDENKSIMESVVAIIIRKEKKMT
jgi:hypothetical protein